MRLSQSRRPLILMSFVTLRSSTLTSLAPSPELAYFIKRRRKNLALQWRIVFNRHCLWQSNSAGAHTLLRRPKRS